MPYRFHVASGFGRKDDDSCVNWFCSSHNEEKSSRFSVRLGGFPETLRVFYSYSLLIFPSLATHCWVSHWTNHNLYKYEGTKLHSPVLRTALKIRDSQLCHSAWHSLHWTRGRWVKGVTPNFFTLWPSITYLPPSQATSVGVRQPLSQDIYTS